MKKDLIHSRFGSLEVKKAAWQTKQYGTFYLCICKCGLEINVSEHDLVGKKTTGCRICSFTEKCAKQA